MTTRAYSIAARRSTGRFWIAHYFAGLSDLAAGASVVVAFFAFFFDLCVVFFVAGVPESAIAAFGASAFMGASAFIGAAFAGSAALTAGAGVAGAVGAVPCAYAVAANAIAHSAVRSLLIVSSS
jgi:hypothetical protein